MTPKSHLYAIQYREGHFNKLIYYSLESTLPLGNGEPIRYFRVHVQCNQSNVLERYLVGI